jgi:hypothetical protein
MIVPAPKVPTRMQRLNAAGVSSARGVVMTRFFLFAMLCLIALTPARADTLLGLAPNARDGGGEEAFKEVLAEQKRIGTDGAAWGVKWSDLEKEPGKIDVKKLGDDLKSAASYLGWKATLTIQAIDTVNRVVPKDLMNEPWDSPKMRDRFDALLRAIIPLLDKNVVAVSLSNEVNAYLEAHPSELRPFKAFLAHAKNTIKAAKPAMPVGVTCIFEGWRANPKFIEGLFEGMDAVFFTYYPMGDAMKVRPISTIGPDLASMVKVAAGRPLVLAEVGYATDPLLGGSEAKQVECVKAFFSELAKHRSKVLLASWFLQTDFSPSLVNQLVGYYGIDAANFRAFLSSLGLRKSDGMAKPALAAFEAAVKSFRSSK